jgi:DNA-binding CsgD family transcriptional regulator
MASMSSEHAVLTEIIAAIGERDFAERSAVALCDFTGFDRVTLISHDGDGEPCILFENLSKIGCGLGVRNYVRATHRINPMLRCGRRGAIRARDYAFAAAQPSARKFGQIVSCDDEELGYRTVGWPERHEEIGLYLDGGDRVFELGLYRERARTAASVATLRALDRLSAPIAAALGRHRALARAASAYGQTGRLDRLTGRERQVADLLLTGYSSGAIALQFGISRHTVKDHRKNIFRKLQVSSLAELFSIAR